MIVSCAPFRVSFAGGGSDIPAFYRQHGGAVLSCTITKYSFVVIHPYFNHSGVHLKYSSTELVDRPEDVKHPIMREALKMLNVDSGIEIASIADIPSGTGLGSSSSFCTALLNGLHAHANTFVSKEQLAREACTLEIERLGEPIGKQDQYAAAYGGLNFIEFNQNDSVVVHPLTLSPDCSRQLERRLLLFYTGDQRDAREILASQTTAMSSDQEKQDTVRRMVDLAREMRSALMQEDLDGFAEALHRGWVLKRSLSSSISTSTADRLYETALENGAVGGKLAGAGGGGFLVLYCPPEKQKQLRESLAGYQELPFRFDWAGARIAFAQ
jgi:D-glycero-alpha-D-manno-heptose-7-phosphate kinase